MSIKSSVNRPIMLEEIVKNLDLEMSTLVGMKDILLDLSNKIWRKERCKKFFKGMMSNNINFTDTEDIILTMLQHRVTAEDLHYISSGDDEKSHPTADRGYEFLSRSLDMTDINMLLDSEVIEKTSDDVDFYYFVSQS